MKILKNIFSDIPMFFEVNQFDGDIKLKKDVAAIRESIKNIILTVLNERPFDSEFGTILYTGLFQNPYEFSFYVENSISMGLERYETRIKLLSLKSNFSGRTLNISIEYNIKGYDIFDSLSFGINTERFLSPPPPETSNTADYTVPLEHNKRIFVQMLLAPINFNADPSGWHGMTTTWISTFQGDRYLTGGGPWGSPNPSSLTRAYPWEYDPANPTISSPWHNVLYELVIEPYLWGSRAVLLFMPFGALADVNALTFQEWKTTFNSTTDPKTCPARWKGFKEAVKALLDGNLRPVGKVGITEPMNVAIYSPPVRGDPGLYRAKSTKIWDSIGTESTTNDQKDAIFYERYLEPYIDDIISMKGTTANCGKLYMLYDTMITSATPSSISTYRSTTNYRTDQLELSDWYMFNKLKNNGVQVFVEARACKSVADPITGITFTNDFAFEPSVSGYYWWMFTQNGNFCDLAKSSDVKTAFIFEDSSFPLSTLEWDTYKPRITTKLNGRTRTLFYDDTKPPGGANFNTPHYNAWSMYSISDNYRYYENKRTNTTTFKGIKLDIESFISVGLDKVCRFGTVATFTDNIDPFKVYWRLDQQFNVYRPLLHEPTWNSIPNIQNYGGITLGVWSTEGINYWESNVRTNTFNQFITFMDDFSRNNAPVSNDWNGVTYGFDPIAINTIHYV